MGAEFPISGGGGGSPTGNAGGDLASTYPNPTVKAGAITSSKLAADLTLPGNPTAATQGVRNNSTRLATTAYVDSSRYGGQTLLVAASDSSAAAKRAADYVCTGTDDDLVINAALAALPAGHGGTVLLAESDGYQLGHSGGGVGVQILNGNQHLRGLANRDSTRLQVVSGATLAQMIQVGTSGTGNLFNNTVERLSLDGTNGQSTMNGLIASSNMFRAESLYLSSIPQDAISLSSFITVEFAFQRLIGIDIYNVTRDGVVTDANINDLRCEEVTCGGIFGSAGRYGFNVLAKYAELVACRAHDFHLGWGVFAQAAFMLEILGGHFDENGAGVAGGGIHCDATTRLNLLGGRFNSNDSYDVYLGNTSNSTISGMQANGAGTKGPKVTSLNLSGCTNVTIGPCALVDMQTRALVIASSSDCHATGVIASNPTAAVAHESARLFSSTSCTIKGGSYANGITEDGTSNSNLIDQPRIGGGSVVVGGAQTVYIPFLTMPATAAALTTETSRATTAEALLAPKASPTLTGSPLAPTQSAADNSTKIATTAYADRAVGTENTRALAAEALLAALASPTFTGSPKAPTKGAGDNSTNVATTAYTDGAISTLTGTLYFPWLAEGFLGWSFDQAVAAASGNLLTAGLTALARIDVPETIVVTNLVARLEVIGSVLTASQCWGTVYSSTGAIIGSTADQSTAWSTGSARTLSMALAGGPFTITGGPGVRVYGALLSNGTTQPSFQKAGSNDPNGGQASPGANLRACRVSSPTSTTPPVLTGAPMAALVSTFFYWMALS